MHGSRGSSTYPAGELTALHILRSSAFQRTSVYIDAVMDTAPEYLIELCRSNAEDAACSRLRSAAHHGNLQVPRSKTNFDDRAFAVAGPASRNTLPATVRSSDTAEFQEQIESSLLLMNHFFH